MLSFLGSCDFDFRVLEIVCQPRMGKEADQMHTGVEGGREIYGVDPDARTDDRPATGQPFEHGSCEPGKDPARITLAPEAESTISSSLAPGPATISAPTGAKTSSSIEKSG